MRHSFPSRILPQMRFSFLLVVLACAANVTAQVASPTVDQILSLKRAGSPQIAPDGRFVAYTIQRTNWDENAYETDLWLADTQTGGTRQLTAARKSSLAPAWSPDGTRLAFLSDRSEKRQIYLIDPHGGEADRLTSVEEGVSSFAWAPDSQTIAYASTEPQSASSKDRDKKYGEFQIVDADKR